MEKEKRGREKSNYSSCKKRGQVTVFVILGIVILVVVLFAIFTASTLSKLKIQSAANKAVESYLASEAVNYYVYTCMDAAVTSAIDDFALQGGLFYDYQRGPYKITENDFAKTYIPFSLSYPNTLGETTIRYFNVSYSILDTGYCSIVSPLPPEYPLSRTFIRDLYGIYNDENRNNDCLVNFKEGYALSGFAGANNMSRLCTLGGNNTRSISNIEFSPCYKSVIKNINKSAEHLLEEQISLRMKECAKFEIFVDDNITVLNDPVTKVTYTSDSLFAETTYNLSVKIKNKEPIVVKHSFNYKSNIRIALVHNYVMSLVKADSQEFFFNVFNDYKTYPLHGEVDPGRFFDSEYMNVKILNFTDCDNCPEKYDKLIIVEDKKSKIGNRSLTYITAVKNRRPALDFIHETPFEQEFYDIIASDNQEIKLVPKGYDPDDKKVSYSYEGWKETWDETCIVVPNENPDAASPFEVQCTMFNVDADLIRNWTRSEDFVRTQTAASYTTKTYDIGVHNVTITVSDESGLNDFQIVKIFVFDMPKAELEPITLYEFDGMASIEDLLPLDGSNSQASQIAGGEIQAFIWKIYLNEGGVYREVFVNMSSADSIIVPSEYAEINNNDILIQVIKPLNLSNTGTHNVTLVVNALIPLGVVVPSEPDYEEIEVMQCVPHSNPDDPYPFPYNIGVNPFEATHSCCSESFQIMGGETSCFSEERYGAYNILKSSDVLSELSNNERFTHYPYSPSVNDVPGSLPLPSSTGLNDVYKLSFTRLCDGIRGNICAGDVRTEITFERSCNDRGAGETETCSGPSPQVFEESPQCVNYAPGFSFETMFNLNAANGQPADGICNEAPRCSSISTNTYNAGGPMLCRATCNGNGDCSGAYYVNDACHCSVDVCGTNVYGVNGAQCDSASDFNLSTVGNSLFCQNNCALSSTCKFGNNVALPCDGGASGVCLSNKNGFAQGRCYRSVTCNGQIASSGVLGSYCAVGLDVDNPNVCIYNPTGIATGNVCDTANGNCRLQRQTRPSTTCPEGQSLACNPQLGWRCQ